VTTTGVLAVLASVPQDGCMEDYMDLQKRLTEVQAKEVFSRETWTE